MLNFIINSVKAFAAFLSKKPKASEIMLKAMTDIPQMAMQAIDFWGADKKEKFDQMLETLDLQTGSDQGAIDLFRDIPADQEEIFWDGIKAALKVIGYNKLGVPGYTEKSE